MKSNILDRSESYLRIFTESFQIDRNLPKWSRITEENKDLLPENNKYEPTPIETPKQQISILDFINLNKKDFNIYVGKSIADRINSSYIKFNDIALMELDDELNRESKEKSSSLIKKLLRVFSDIKNTKKVIEPVYELDVLKFFEQVKLTSKESAKDYVERIKPYMVALKRANDMGQTALADQLTEQIFNNKYESILRAEGFYYKITEEQLVSFIKKTEKGVRLDYIKNFIRNIPDEVFDIKIKADSLLVFDNYCVLYYDPDTKSYKKLKRKKKENVGKRQTLFFSV